MQITRKNRNRTKYRNKNRRYFSKKNINYPSRQYGGAEIVNQPLNSIQAASDQANQQFNTGLNKINNRIQSATNRIQSATNRIQSATNYAANKIQSAANAKEALKNDISDLSNMKNKIKPLFQSIVQSSTSEPIVPKEGILDIASDTLSNAVEKGSDFVGDKLLRLIGLQPINADNPNSSEQPNNPLEEPINIASRIAAKVLNIANNKFGNILQKLNEFLDSPETQMNIAEAGKNLVDKFILLLKQFNETLDNPILKEEFVLAVYILGVYAKIFVDSTEEPLDKAIDLLNQAIVKAASGLSTGAVKVVMDVVGVVPFLGEILDVSRALND
jgi:DNA repair exonuclease SbcCD ATPase subunit